MFYLAKQVHLMCCSTYSWVKLSEENYEAIKAERAQYLQSQLPVKVFNLMHNSKRYELENVTQFVL